MQNGILTLIYTLLLVVPSKFNVKENNPITINDRPIDSNSINIQSDDEVIIVDFMLEKEDWSSALRSIQPEDYIPLFGKERVGNANNGYSDFGAPMDTGKILKINVELTLDNGETKTLTKFFHIAYGE